MRTLPGAVALALISGCAKQPGSIQPKFATSHPYRGMSCEQLNDERARVQSELARLTALQRENANADAAMMTVGLVLLWPALLGLAATTDRSDAIASMMGERDAMDIVAREKGCPAVSVGAPAPEPSVATPEV
ncbi:hypothetical protein [Elioraea sp.]|uniref:hypothetical protein n=1 Tax=Elioraea sp. TaxID=2185103 RepID=UPI003F72DF72